MGVSSSSSQNEETQHTNFNRLQAAPRKTNIGKEAVSDLRNNVLILLSKQDPGFSGITEELALRIDEEFLTQVLVNFSMQAGLLHLDKSSSEYKGQIEMVQQAVMQQILSETLLPPFYQLFSLRVNSLYGIEDTDRMDYFTQCFHKILAEIEAYQQFCQDFFIEVLRHIHTHERTNKRLINFAVSSAFFNPSLKISANPQSSKQAKAFILDFFRLFSRSQASFENDLKVNLPQLRSPEIQSSKLIQKVLKKSQFLTQAQEEIKKITTITSRTNFPKTMHILTNLLEKYYEFALFALRMNTIESASQRVYLNINFLFCLNTPGMYTLCSFVHEYLGFLLSPDEAHRLTSIIIAYQQIKQYLTSPVYNSNDQLPLFETTKPQHSQSLTLLGSPEPKVSQNSPMSEFSTQETENSSNKRDSPIIFGDTPQVLQSKKVFCNSEIPQTRCFSAA